MDTFTIYLIKNRKELLEQVRNRDEIIEYLLDALENEHWGIRGEYVKEIEEKYNLYY